MFYAITIDGPAGSGKSTLAKNIQQKLPSFVLVDTGAYYRWATYLCLEAGVDENKQSQVYKHVKDQMQLLFIPYPKGHKFYSAHILHNGEEINKKIFTVKVTEKVPIIAQYKKVRDLVKKMITKLSGEYNVIVAGRDIGTSVLPSAKVKIFLNPAVDARVRRRYRDQIKQGRSLSLSKMKDEMEKRDSYDKKRKHGPLKKPIDAIEIDNTFLTASSCLKEAMKYIMKKIPDVQNMQRVDWKKIRSERNFNSSFAESSSFVRFQNTTVEPEENNKESLAELKKRLKAKYKQSTKSGNFFNRYKN